MQKNHGKGLTGFIFGLLLATLIIGAVLFFLNHAPSGFRQPDPPPEVVSKPEELRPRGSQVQAPPVQKPQDGGLADPWGDIAEADASEAVPPKAAEASKPEPQPVPKPERTAAESKPRPPAEAKPQPREPRPEPKPTPEQILNSGSVEKAREQVRREQQDRRAANRAAEGGRVVVQMGSFNNAEAADAQRAKLAMLGVNARLSRTTGKDGQTVYRIQSGRLSREEAQRLTDKLRQNNIDSLTRNAE
ncbi:MAG: SPOR domain-containing protein [Eikenella sp.]|nr:SPOR domain-containing protein [Eikenella sp.]